MTVDEAARILRDMYDAGGSKTTAIHVFGIKYANELSGLPIKEIVRQSGLSETYPTEIYKGIRLAEYVKMVKEFP